MKFKKGVMEPRAPANGWTHYYPRLDPVPRTTSTSGVVPEHARVPVPHWFSLVLPRVSGFFVGGTGTRACSRTTPVWCGTGTRACSGTTLTILILMRDHCCSKQPSLFLAFAFWFFGSRCSHALTFVRGLFVKGLAFVFP